MSITAAEPVIASPFWKAVIAANVPLVMLVPPLPGSPFVSQTLCVACRPLPVARFPEQVVQRADAAVAAHVHTPPNRRVDLEKQDVLLLSRYFLPKSLIDRYLEPRGFEPLTSSMPLRRSTN